MLLVLKLGSILIFLSSFASRGDAKLVRVKEEAPPPKRDYRPSKWLANSAMDVWYGNKSMVEVIFRELSDVMYRLTMRPAREATLGKPLLMKSNITSKNAVNSTLNIQLPLANSAEHSFTTIEKEQRNIDDNIEILPGIEQKSLLANYISVKNHAASNKEDKNILANNKTELTAQSLLSNNTFARNYMLLVEENSQEEESESEEYSDEIEQLGELILQPSKT